MVFGGLCYLYRRRRGLSTVFDGHSTFPYTVPPMAQTNQQPSLPWNRKRPPQTTLQPGVPVPMSRFGLSELGPPPSYQS